MYPQKPCVHYGRGRTPMVSPVFSCVSSCVPSAPLSVYGCISLVVPLPLSPWYYVTAYVAQKPLVEQKESERGRRLKGIEMEHTCPWTLSAQTIMDRVYR